MSESLALLFMNKFIIREVFCNLREISGIKKHLPVEF